jgi:hypothetical protein
MARTLQDVSHLSVLERAMLKNVLAAMTAAFSLMLSFPVFATPFVDVRATWSAAPHEWMGIPEGLSVSCWGGASGSDGFCGDTISLNQSMTNAGTLSASSVGGLVLTNTSSAAINGFAVFSVAFSAFNPGGPGVGLGIDDPLTQWASFTSSVRGDGSVGDAHACSVGYLGESGTVFSPTACGVSSPDSSVGDAVVDLVDFMPGAEVVLTWSLNIAATFVLADEDPTGVPEPAAALLLAAGIAALRLRRRRQGS